MKLHYIFVGFLLISSINLPAQQSKFILSPAASQQESLLLELINLTGDSAIIGYRYSC